MRKTNKNKTEPISYQAFRNYIAIKISFYSHMSTRIVMYEYCAYKLAQSTEIRKRDANEVEVRMMRLNIWAEHCSLNIMSFFECLIHGHVNCIILQLTEKSSSVPSITLNLYADDTQLNKYFSSSYVNVSIDEVNSDLQYVLEWAVANKLELIAGKTKSILSLVLQLLAWFRL